MTMNNLSQKPYALYRCFDKDKNLIYIGISASVLARLSQHSHQSHWFSELVYVKIEKFDSLCDAAYAEKNAIKNEHPQFNIVYNRPQKIKIQSKRSKRRQTAIKHVEEFMRRWEKEHEAKEKEKIRLAEEEMKKEIIVGEPGSRYFGLYLLIGMKLKVSMVNGEKYIGKSQYIFENALVMDCTTEESGGIRQVLLSLEHISSIEINQKFSPERFTCTKD